MPDYTPDTIVKVLTNVPLDNTYTDTLKFLSPANQQAYFNGKVKYTYTNLSYQRINSSVAQPRGPLTVRVPQVADNLYDCNYIMFQNSNYGTKWFYAFIKQVNFISPENTEIVYELDHYQTWAFDYTVIPSMVLREHVSSDEPFEWLAPEPVSIYGYEIDSASFWDGTQNINKYIVCLFSEDPSWDLAGGTKFDPAIFAGVFCGLYGCYYSANTTGAANVKQMLDSADSDGKGDSIINIYMCTNPPTAGEVSSGIATSLPTQATNFFGYGPIKNNKLMSHPYRYFMITSSDGNSEIYKPQYVNNSENLTAYLYRSPNTAGTMAFAPQYEGLAQNYNRMVTYDETPICAWRNDVYKNWVSQNQTNNGLKVLGGVVKTALGIAISALSSGIGAIAGGGTLIASGVGDIGGVLGNDYTAKNHTPDTASGNGLNGNISWAINKVGFLGYEFKITAENAEYIDNYFEMYGYQVNMLKVPNETGRESWNYVKTQNVILNGSIPVESMDRIKKMYNDGVRFWHGDYVGDYSRSNKIVKKTK